MGSLIRSLLACIAVFLVSCTPRGPWFGTTTTGRTDTLVINNGGEPETLDPNLMSGAPEGRLASELFEGLTRKHPKTLEPLPGVADRWDVRDGHRRYVFHLRTNARWSNGRRVTAGDFVYSWRRLLDPRTASRYAEFLYCIRNGKAFNKGTLKDPSQLGVRAVDENTLEVLLEQPTPYFLEITSFYVTYPVPKEAIEKHGGRWIRPGNIVGNGPFLLKEWKMHNRITLVKNPTYWGNRMVRLKRVVFLAVNDDAAALNLYRSGEIDILFSYPLEMHPFLRTKKDFYSSPGWGTYYYKINTTRGVLKNRLVRRALTKAIDRKQIVRFLNGGQVAATTFTPPFIRDYKPPAGYGFDPKAALRTLARAGYPGGRGFPELSILYNTMESHKHIAEIIQKMWEKHLNIKVKLRNQEWKVFLNTTSRLEHDIARSGWIGDFFDPATFLDMFRSKGGNNNTGWSPPEYAGLISRALSAGNRGERMALFRRAETIMNRDVPLIPIYYYSFYGLVKPYVKGFHANYRDEHPLREVYVQNPGVRR